MQSTAIPFKSPTFVNFIFVTIGLVIMMWLVLTLLLKVSWARQGMTAWIEPKSGPKAKENTTTEKKGNTLNWSFLFQKSNLESSDLEGRRVSDVSRTAGEPAIGILVP